MGEKSPLEVLLEVMRVQLQANEYDRAVAAAKLAAPYVHGRAPGIRPPRDYGGDLAGVPDDELDRWERERREAAAGEGPEEPV